MSTIDKKLESLIDSLLNQLEGNPDLGLTMRVFEVIKQAIEIRQMNEFSNISKKG